jgi:ribosomal protein S18 acetylase RimI-like enzyme
MLETMQATPGLRRIEAQLMAFAPSELADAFKLMGFRSYRRLFMYLRLNEASNNGQPRAGVRPPAIRLEPWGTASLDAAATLINRAYQHHIDSEVNDQYCTLAGSLRFLNNVIQYPGCGTFDEAASALARSATSDRLEGLILASRVKDDVAHITQICVAPDRQHKGIGEALLVRTVRSLRDRGFEAVTLTVTQANVGAVRLYEQFGFGVLREFDAYVWDRRMH